MEGFHYLNVQKSWDLINMWSNLNTNLLASTIQNKTLRNTNKTGKCHWIFHILSKYLVYLCSLYGVELHKFAKGHDENIWNCIYMRNVVRRSFCDTAMSQNLFGSAGWEVFCVMWGLTMDTQEDVHPACSSQWLLSWKISLRTWNKSRDPRYRERGNRVIYKRSSKRLVDFDVWWNVELLSEDERCLYLDLLLMILVV